RQTKNRAAVGRRVDADAAVVRIGNLLHDRQAQAGAGCAARVERAVEAVEDERLVLRRDTGAAVADLHDAVSDRYIDRLAGRAPLPRVVEQVVDGTLDTFGDTDDL